MICIRIFVISKFYIIIKIDETIKIDKYLKICSINIEFKFIKYSFYNN